MNLLKNNNIYLLAIVLAILLNIFSWHLPFFWDTILTSTITQHFYDYGFHDFITPAQFDAGHPPLFYIYVTAFYHLFGKNLMAAHLSMLPFTILGIVSFISLLQHFSFSKTQQIMGVVLFFTIPAVITQNTLVSYDAVLLSLYLAALVSYFNKNKILFVFLILGIVGISLRGLFCVASLSVTIFFLENKQFKTWFKWNLMFVPAIILIAVWYMYHYTQTGWLFATKAEGWSEQRGLADAMGLLKNGFSIARCFFDLGILILTSLSVFYFIQKRKLDKYTLLWLIPAIVFSIAFLPFTNPINHRYFLIVYVMMLFPVIQFLSERKRIYIVFTTLILLLGHFQIYPVPISNGWDCTLEYTSYSYLRNEYLNSFKVNSFINISQTGTVFPMNASLFQTNMKNDTVKLMNINGKSIDSIPRILFSNIGNDFSNEQIEQLQKWDTIYRSQEGLVYLVLLANPQIPID